MISKELEAFFEYILINRSLSKNTLLAYKSDLIALENFYAAPLIELDTQAVLNLLSKIDNKRTLNRKLSVLNSFFEFCYKQSFKDENIKLQHSKLPKKLPHFISHQFIMDALSHIDITTWIGLRDRALILFLYATGARISEALNLRREDIEGEWLRITQAKGDKQRLIHIASSALEAIRSYEQAAPFDSEYVWLNYKGSVLSRISAFKITKKYLNVSPHVLRHSYATSLISGGADLRIVQELLGHASLLTTQIYTHVQKQSLQETVEACHPMSHLSL